MIDLLTQADPARGVEPDVARLRAAVDERIGLSAPVRPTAKSRRNGWLIASGALAGVLVAVAAPILLRQEPASVYAPGLDGLRQVPGVERVIPVGVGGVKTTALDGETIWLMAALQHELYRISATTGNIEQTFPIGAYVEGVQVGGGYVWLLSYDDGGQVLRFDPARGSVDAAIPIDGPPGGAAWFGDALWVSNQDGDLRRITADGDVQPMGPGQLKGDGLGYLWVNDPTTGLITSLAEDGTLGDVVVPTYAGRVTSDGFGVRGVTEAGGYLWLMDDDYPWGTNVSRFDPDTGELESIGVTFGLDAMTEYDGSLWLTSQTDHLLMRMDPETGDFRRYPMPGKSGGVLVADDSLWVTLFHPGALIRLDPDAGLIEAGEIVSDAWELFPERLLCTGTGAAGAPTVILEPPDWIEYGYWSVIQARLSAAGHVVCAHGYLEGEATPRERAAALEDALATQGIPGPYVLVAAGDGVHTTRLFADGRDDVAGVVLVDPTPVGFGPFLDDTVGSSVDDPGHPDWLDLDTEVSAGLDFGDAPLVVIGQDPTAVYRSELFADAFGEQAAGALDTAWQEGLDFYAGLSPGSRSVVAPGTGKEWIVWDQPDLVVDEILDVLDN